MAQYFWHVLADSKINSQLLLYGLPEKMKCSVEACEYYRIAESNQNPRAKFMYNMSNDPFERIFSDILGPIST